MEGNGKNEIERERKFLFRKFPPWVPEAGTFIEQGFVEFLGQNELQSRVSARAGSGLISVPAVEWSVETPLWVALRAVDPGAAFRLRRTSEKAELNVKGKTVSGVGMPEWEETVPTEVFDHLWPLTAAERLGKTRTKVKAPTDPTLPLEFTGEWDRFHGPLNGVFMTEVEFPSQDAFLRFVVPVGWLAFNPVEVTYDRRFTNRSLARVKPSEVVALLSSVLGS